MLVASIRIESIYSHESPSFMRYLATYMPWAFILLQTAVVAAQPVHTAQSIPVLKAPAPASTTLTSVPEPMTMAVVGAVLVGIGLSRRKSSTRDSR